LISWSLKSRQNAKIIEALLLAQQNEKREEISAASGYN